MDKYEKKKDKTKNKLKAAFFQVAEDKDLLHITVKEVSAAAEVGRSTFYMHYENIEDLIREIESEILEEIEEILLHPPKMVPQASVEGHPEYAIPFYYEMNQFLNFLYDNRRRMLPFIYPQQDAFFVNKFKDLVGKKLVEYEEASPLYDDHSHITFFMNIGITGTMFHWLIHQNMPKEEFLKMALKINKLIGL
ncbi:hypothetical protein [Eubacterium sp. 1001713B170207_170306_E7]|uniref:hypothetical protein n=1 Tax=Eubacterium sp. 1001713B170207_170306_E7 TaxID=2787097 RepID=UPI00189B3375|nr:hypothetical protein [Eubacterium sp. 1001713B170207_170306_E7]